MTRTETDKTYSLICAAAAGLAVALALLLSRLPPSAALILPRRPFFGFFELAMAQAGRLWILAPLLMLSAAGTFLWRAARIARSNPNRRLGWVAAGLSGLALGAYHALRLLLDLVQNVWGAPQNVDFRESLGVFLMVFALAGLGARSSFALLRWATADARERGRHAAYGLAFAAAFLVPAALLYAWAGRYDIHKRDLAEAAGIPAEPAAKRTLLVLTEGPDGPNYELQSVVLGVPGRADYSSGSLESLEAYLARGRTVFSRAAARALYGGYALQMEAWPLRQALFKHGLQGDPVARLLLLDNLARAPVEGRQAALLEGLADESVFRMGAQAAAMLAVAYGHFGLSEKAAYWESRASLGPYGVAPGLIAAPSSLYREGAIRGRIEAPGCLKIGLYARRDRDAPYELGPGELVGSAVPGDGGRFEFEHLAPGIYFLALAFGSDKPADSDQVAVLGHSGDIRLSLSRRKAELRLRVRWK